MRLNPSDLLAQSLGADKDVLDEWFDSASDVSDRRPSSAGIQNDSFSLPIGSSTFRQDLFQPIRDNIQDNAEHSSTAQSPVMSDEETKAKRVRTLRMSESGAFRRDS